MYILCKKVGSINYIIDTKDGIIEKIDDKQLHQYDGVRIRKDKRYEVLVDFYMYLTKQAIMGYFPNNLDLNYVYKMLVSCIELLKLCKLSHSMWNYHMEVLHEYDIFLFSLSMSKLKFGNSFYFILSSTGLFRINLDSSPMLAGLRFREVHKIDNNYEIPYTGYYEAGRITIDKLGNVLNHAEDYIND